MIREELTRIYIESLEEDMKYTLPSYRKELAEEAIKKAKENNQFICFYRIPDITDEQYREVFNYLGELKESTINKLITEVNEQLVDYHNYVSKDLTDRIVDALKNNNYKRLNYKEDGQYPWRLYINDPNNEFPIIYLKDLTNYGEAEYNAIPNTITIDMLNDEGNIDLYKKDFFINNAQHLISHELSHKDTYELFKSMNNLESLVKDAKKPETKQFNEIKAFKYQITSMVEMTFANNMHKIIRNNPDIKLEVAASEALNNVITSFVKKNTAFGSFLNNVEESVKKAIYKYAWFKAKDLFLRNYNHFKDYQTRYK